jgi:hypothetical protein
MLDWSDKLTNLHVSCLAHPDGRAGRRAGLIGARQAVG